MVVADQGRSQHPVAGGDRVHDPWPGRLQGAGDLAPATADARRLTVVPAGSGTVESTAIGALTAVEAAPGEQARFVAAQELVRYSIGLPPIQQPAVPSDQFDIVTTDGGIEFESAPEQRA